MKIQKTYQVHVLLPNYCPNQFAPLYPQEAHIFVYKLSCVGATEFQIWVSAEPISEPYEAWFGLSFNGPKVVQEKPTNRPIHLKLNTKDRKTITS